MVPPQGHMDKMLFPGSGCSAVPAHHTEPVTQQNPVKSIPTFLVVGTTVSSLFPPQSHLPAMSHRHGAEQFTHRARAVHVPATGAMGQEGSPPVKECGMVV